MGKHIAFGWYGGKFSHLDWLLPLLPKAKHFCEPFAGSAAVLINREPSPVETYNDWQTIEGPTKLVHSVKQPRTEMLWVNYEISDLNKHKSGSKMEEWQALQKSLMQKLVLAEPESAVSQPLKEAFLALRRAAESRE